MNQSKWSAYKLEKRCMVILCNYGLVRFGLLRHPCKTYFLPNPKYLVLDKLAHLYNSHMNFEIAIYIYSLKS